MAEVNTQQLEELRDWIRTELNASINFWLEKGMDHENGGVYTCLDRKGEIYSTDKSVWMQGRCGWMFSYLTHLYGDSTPDWLDTGKEEWLAAAKC